MFDAASKPKLSFFLGSVEEVQCSRELETSLARIAQLGYEAVEFAAASPADLDLRHLIRTLNLFSLRASAFLTGGIYARYGVCFASPNAETRATAIQHVVDLMTVARECQALLVLGLIQGQRRDATDLASAQANIVECLKRVGHEAERHGVVCVLEPVNHLEVGFNHTVAEVTQVLDRVGCKAVRIMADTFHLNIEEASVDGVIRACGATLTHLHLCETNRRIFGTGHMDFGRVFRTLGETGYQRYCTVVTEYGEQRNWEKQAQTASDVLARLTVATP